MKNDLSSHLKIELLEHISKTIDVDPSFCEDLSRLVADKMSMFRQNALKQSTALADNAISSLAALSFVKADREPLIGFCLPAIIHEFRFHRRSCNATNAMAEEFVRVEGKQSPEQLDRWYAWMDDTHGPEAVETVKWVMKEFAPKAS
jgi:hypothetical protein